MASWLSVVVSNCEFVTFPIGILGQVCYLIVSIHDLCTLTNCVVPMTDPLGLGKIRHMVLKISLWEFQDGHHERHIECWNETILN